MTTGQTPPLYVNIRVLPFRAEDFEFIAVQHLQPEFYFSAEAAETFAGDKLESLITQLNPWKFSPLFHSPFYDLNPGAHDPKIRAISENRIIQSLETAKKLGATQVVVHPGYGPWVLKRSFPNWLERARESLAKIVAKAVDLQIRIAFENIYDPVPDDLAALISLFPAETVGVCFDIGHFNLFSETAMKTWLDTLGDRIIEVHLHDNLGSEDDHIAIGDGTVKFGTLLAWLPKHRQRVRLTLEMEQRTHVIKSVTRLREWLNNSPQE